MGVTEPEETVLQTGNRQLAARVWGPADGSRVLALHGWLDNAATFDRLAPHLPELRIVALDLPGHGRSSHNPKGVLYPFMDLAADVWRAVEALGWDRFALLGHSMGAAIGAVLAGTFPDRITRLVLLEGLGPLSEAVERTPDRFRDALADELRRTASSKRVFSSPAAVVERLQAAGSAMTPESARCLVARGTTPVDGGVTWAADPKLRIASRLRLTESQVLEFLRRIEAPTLAVRASDGWAADPELMRTRLETIGNARRVELAGHHHVHLDDPVTVAAHVAPFLMERLAP